MAWKTKAELPQRSIAMDAKQQAESLIREGATDIFSAARSIGVELRGEEGQPFCCGARMDVRSGIIGPDYSRCKICGNVLFRIDSPHTNGGVVLTQEVCERLDNRVWFATPGREFE